jgi:distribution and morphology protein 34
VFLAADAPLTVPMFLRLSDFQLSGIIILVFSKQKGLTLVFRNDPVDSVKVSSTFDSIPAIQRFLQAEIERLLRDLMREEVPAIIHKLSLDWAMRHQADECLSPASLTNTESNPSSSGPNYPYSIDMDLSDPLRPVFSMSNIRRLSELSLAQHTLSPFTPSIPHSAFRSSTSLITSSRLSLLKRPDLFVAKNTGSEPLYLRGNLTSPPESIHSAQSTDPLIRPTLYSRWHRSSNLRRSHPPKRKVVRLRPALGNDIGDASSVHYHQ